MPEYEVNPLVEVRGDVVGLESLSMGAHELGGAALGPRGQNHVVKGLAVLLSACEQKKIVQGKENKT